MLATAAARRARRAPGRKRSVNVKSVFIGRSLYHTGEKCTHMSEYGIELVPATDIGQRPISFKSQVVRLEAVALGDSLRGSNCGPPEGTVQYGPRLARVVREGGRVFAPWTPEHRKHEHEQTCMYQYKPRRRGRPPNRCRISSPNDVSPSFHTSRKTSRNPQAGIAGSQCGAQRGMTDRCGGVLLL